MAKERTHRGRPCCTASLQPPVTSSRMETKVDAVGEERNTRKRSSKTANKMTKQHMESMERAASEAEQISACAAPIPFWETAFPRCLRETPKLHRIPRSRDAESCEAKRITPAWALRKRPAPTTLRTNAGPELTQKQSMRAASCGVISPSWQSAATARAPTG